MNQRLAATGTVRRARMSDAKIIREIIEPYAAKGEMLPRPLTEIYEQLRDFVVYEDGATVLGVAALKLSWEGLAEIRSLAVVESAGHRGIGSTLVEACLEEARLFDIHRVFTLTYRPTFFARFGFHEVNKEIFPQKIWKDCMHCRFYTDCKEIAMQVEV
jgi:amino-acid N-acetyltransferase